MKRFFAIFLMGLISAGLFFAFVIHKRESPAVENIDSQGNEKMITAAREIINSLSEAEKKTALIAFDVEERTYWNFIPMDRKGLRYRDMSEDLRNKTEALLKTGLSEKGFTKAWSIMALEIVLGELEGTGGPNARRDPEKYWLAIFGEPSSDTPWGWRFEGHHLSINFTSVENEIVAYTPIFMGANPAEVPSGPEKGLRILAAEEDLGRSFLQSLDENQRKIAIIHSDAPDEMITSNDRKAELSEPDGIAYKVLNEAQKKQFMELVTLYVSKMEKGIADEQWKKLRKHGLDNLYFAWAGSVEKKQRHYYRVQGPSLLIEYDNTQNNANHIHTVVRDIENDFGDDALKNHYKNSDHH